MHEMLKSLCVVIILFGVPTAAIVWSDDRPNETVWMVRIVSSVALIAALGLFLKLSFRRDKSPDFLRGQVGNYFNRNGFCFAITPAVEDDVLILQAWFQNQYEHRCKGRIALRPSREFWMNRPDIEGLVFDIECEPGAFGIASIPLPLAVEHHGKRKKFDVGASAEYPEGKGRQLRFHHGLLIRENTEFENPFGTSLTVAGAFAGVIVLNKSASVKLQMPIGVKEAVEEAGTQITHTLWRFGDSIASFSSDNEP